MEGFYLSILNYKEFCKAHLMSYRPETTRFCVYNCDNWQRFLRVCVRVFDVYIILECPMSCQKMSSPESPHRFLIHCSKSMKSVALVLSPIQSYPEQTLGRSRGRTEHPFI